MPRPALPLLVALLLGTLSACDAGRGGAGLGEPCSADEECAEGLCVGGVDGPDPRCTRSCAGSIDCPRGWSCSAVTQNQVVVCKKGSATPFGD